MSFKVENSILSLLQKKKKKKKAEECIMYVTSHKNWILKLKTGTRKLKSSEDLRICLIRPGKLQGRA